MDAMNANGFAFSGPFTGQIAVDHQQPGDARRRVARLRRLRLSRPRCGKIAVVIRGACARVGARGLRPAGRSDRRDHGQQPTRACPRSRADHRQPGHGRGVRRDDPVPRASVASPPTPPRTAPSSARRNGRRRRIVANERSRTPNFKGFASFSSGGPRTGDSFLKPDVTAPGVSIVSTGVGTGNGPATISGTSMASPHAAGVAALTAGPPDEWKVKDLKAVIMNTADPAGVLGYRTSRGGAGLVQPARARRRPGWSRTPTRLRRLAQLRLRGARRGLREDADDDGSGTSHRTRDVQRDRDDAEWLAAHASRSTTVSVDVG